MTEYVIHGEDVKTLYERTNFPFPLKSYLRDPVVRCMNCKYMFDWAYDRMLCKMWADGGMDDDARNVLYPTVEPDGFCAWGKPRDDAS